MSEEPKEAFPWHQDEQFDDSIVDANGDYVATVEAWGGNRASMASPGIAKRRRMILEVPNLIELARSIAALSRSGHEIKAREILARIEGKQET